MDGRLRRMSRNEHFRLQCVPRNDQMLLMPWCLEEHVVADLHDYVIGAISIKGQKRVEQKKGPGWLCRRNHVSCTVHSREGELALIVVTRSVELCQKSGNLSTNLPWQPIHALLWHVAHVPNELLGTKSCTN
mmetsp:Transcript_53455/g.106384  ORF Transcript_53455/g.106384 Transcript_53455/m.106384 type:complete len:132 (+) Transcript_53455:64-459(+)